MLNYNHLYYFHVVASEGSFANAAEKLGVTQPTISEQVKTLERTLGAALFERQPAGLRLTEEGRAAFEHTSVMFRAGGHLRTALGRDPSETPVLRVGISSAVGRSTTTSFFVPLLSIPDCLPSIRTQDTAELVRDLRAGELDLVVLETEPPAAARATLEVVSLGGIALDAVAAPTTTPARDWSNLAIVQYRASSPFRASIDTHLAEHALRPKIAGEAEDALLLVEAAAREGFLTFVPRPVARPAIDAGQLVRIASVESAAALFAVHARTDRARSAVALLASSITSSVTSA